ncbi:hypothetical protein L1049_027345 [Liquidambar formosana]|uniref:Uncharacterized protein n=1 Tax=Liquidambar formosana TaxID=63359 RepID=A0AAP0N679_LIQFO
MKQPAVGVKNSVRRWEIEIRNEKEKGSRSELSAIGGELRAWQGEELAVSTISCIPVPLSYESLGNSGRPKMGTAGVGIGEGGASSATRKGGGGGFGGGV